MPSGQTLSLSIFVLSRCTMRKLPLSSRVTSARTGFGLDFPAISPVRSPYLAARCSSWDSSRVSSSIMRRTRFVGLTLVVVVPSWRMGVRFIAVP